MTADATERRARFFLRPLLRGLTVHVAPQRTQRRRLAPWGAQGATQQGDLACYALLHANERETKELSSMITGIFANDPTELMGHDHDR